MFSSFILLKNINNSFFLILKIKFVKNRFSVNFLIILLFFGSLSKKYQGKTFSKTIEVY